VSHSPVVGRRIHHGVRPWPDTVMDSPAHDRRMRHGSTRHDHPWRIDQLSTSECITVAASGRRHDFGVRRPKPRRPARSSGL